MSGGREYCVEGEWSGLEADYGEGVFLFLLSLLSQLLSSLGAGGTPSLCLSPGGGEIGVGWLHGGVEWRVVVVMDVLVGVR